MCWVRSTCAVTARFKSANFADFESALHVRGDRVLLIVGKNFPHDVRPTCAGMLGTQF